MRPPVVVVEVVRGNRLPILEDLKEERVPKELPAPEPMGRGKMKAPLVGIVIERAYLIYCHCKGVNIASFAQICPHKKLRSRPGRGNQCPFIVAECPAVDVGFQVCQTIIAQYGIVIVTDKDIRTLDISMNDVLCMEVRKTEGGLVKLIV